MRIEHAWITKLGGLSLATLSRHWMATLKYRGAMYDPLVDPVHPRFRGPAIFLFWHEYIPFLFYLRGHCHIAMLVSRHQDAEWLSQAARHMGFGTVRGSSNRGSISALRTLLDKCRQLNLAITPDGPRGPRRRLAAGAIYLSSKLGMPLIAIGLGYDRPWRLPTWDRFAIPRPYCRARGISSPPLQIPAGLDRDGIEHYRQRVEQLLNGLTTTAEQWARSGCDVQGQRPLHRQAIAWRDMRRRAAAKAVPQSHQLATASARAG